MFDYRDDKTKDLLSGENAQPVAGIRAKEAHDRMKKYLRFSYGLIRDNRVAPPKSNSTQPASQPASHPDPK